jgi:hypothetical protein
MREELIRQLQERAGLDEKIAETVADVVLNFVRENGPEILRSAGLSEKGLGGLSGILGQ